MKEPKWWNRKESKRDKVKKQEKKVAKKLRGRVTPGSGNIFRWKGDVLNKYFMIECKRTDKNSISVKKEWIEKLKEDGFANRKVPIMNLEINGVECYIILPSVFKFLLQKYFEEMEVIDYE